MFRGVVTHTHTLTHTLTHTHTHTHSLSLTHTHTHSFTHSLIPSKPPSYLPFLPSPYPPSISHSHIHPNTLPRTHTHTLSRAHTHCSSSFQYFHTHSRVCTLLVFVTKFSISLHFLFLSLLQLLHFIGIFIFMFIFTFLCILTYFKYNNWLTKNKKKQCWCNIFHRYNTCDIVIFFRTFYTEMDCHGSGIQKHPNLIFVYSIRVLVLKIWNHCQWWKYFVTELGNMERTV